jgi:hypothetical protein
MREIPTGFRLQRQAVEIHPYISNALAERSANNYVHVHDLFMSGGHNRCSAVGALFAHGSRGTFGDADEKTKRSLAFHS